MLEPCRIYVVVMIVTMLCLLARSVASGDTADMLPLYVICSLFWPLFFLGMLFAAVIQWSDHE